MAPLPPPFPPGTHGDQLIASKLNEADFAIDNSPPQILIPRGIQPASLRTPLHRPTKYHPRIEDVIVGRPSEVSKFQFLPLTALHGKVTPNSRIRDLESSVRSSERIGPHSGGR